MRLYLIPLLAAFFLMPALLFGQSTSRPPCPVIEAEAEVTPPDPGQSNGQIQITFPEGVNADEYRILWSCTGCGFPEKAESALITGVRRGYYDILVIDKNGCFRQLNPQVE